MVTKLRPRPLSYPGARTSVTRGELHPIQSENKNKTQCTVFSSARTIMSLYEIEISSNSKVVLFQGSLKKAPQLNKRGRKVYFITTIMILCGE